MEASGTKQLLADLSNEGLRPYAQFDFWVGIAAAATFGWAGWTHPVAALRPTSAALGLTGVVVGAVLAGVAIQTAFMDQTFLRTLHAIGRKPIRYLAPFLYTALLGIAALTGLVGLSVAHESWPSILLSGMLTVTWFFVGWAVASILPCLAMVAQFADLKMIAAQMPSVDTETN